MRHRDQHVEGGKRPVAITGIGVLAPGGIGREAFWELVTSGRTATRPLSRFDAGAYRSRIAGECDFDPAAAGLCAREAERMDRAAAFAVTCAREALADSGLAPARLDPCRTGVSLGSAIGCIGALDAHYPVVSAQGGRWHVDHTRAAPSLHAHHVPSSLAHELAWAVAAEGPVVLVSNGCTSGIDAVAHAAQLVGEGSADVMITGATDAGITPIIVACFDAIRATSANNEDPEHAARPFDRDRDGFVLAEGAAVFVVEALERARDRGAHIYAEFAGFASRSNAFHMTGLRPDGRELAAAIEAALDRASAAPGDVDYVNAHGSGTRQNDVHETAAYKRSFGRRAYDVPISSIKSMVGHSLGAIGSIELAACALAIERGVIPPTANLRSRDPQLDLDYVPLEARDRPVDVALCVASGFGGLQSAAVLRAA